MFIYYNFLFSKRVKGLFVLYLQSLRISNEHSDNKRCVLRAKKQNQDLFKVFQSLI